MRIDFKYLLLLLHFTIVFWIRAQENSYSVNKTLYTQEDGLPSSEVACGVQDQRNFLWFATRNGLCRFDGINFDFVPTQQEELKTWTIESLVTDDKESIIITYANPTQNNAARKRLVLNTITYQLTTLNEHFVNMTFADTTILAIYKAQNNELGFLLKNPFSVWHYNPKWGFKQHFKNNTALKNWAYLNYNVQDVFETSNMLLLGWRGLKTMLVNKDKVFDFTSTPNYFLSVHDTGVSVFSYDHTTRRITDTRNLNANGQLIPHCTYGKNSILNYKDGYLTFAFCSDNDNSSILNYSNNVILLYNKNYGKFNVFANLTNNSFTPKVLSYFKDNNGLYWICTSKGVVKLKISKNRFVKHFNQTANFHTASHSTRGIYANNQLFCANLLDMAIIATKNDTTIIRKGSNYSLMYTDTGLWIGAFDIRFYDFKTKRYRLETKSKSNEIWSLFQLDKNKLLLGCTSNLDIYDISHNTILTYANKGFPKPVFVYKFFKNPNGEIWAIADNGIFVLSNKGLIIDYYGYLTIEKDHHLPFASLRDLFIDKDGMYWIATNGEGLCKWNRQANSFQFYDITKNFPSNVIYGIQEDSFGNLWISSDFGLIKFNKRSEFVKTYTVKDGITDNEFNRASQFKSDNGTIYFGGVNGVTSFHPSEFASDTAQINFGFYITSCIWYNKIQNTTQNITANVIRKNEIIIHPEIDYFMLTFSLLNYEVGIRHYAYKIEGLDNDWNYITENKLRFSNLPYGKYKLYIKAKTANGSWNSHQIELLLSVETPFYKTWWFIILAFITSILILGLLFFVRLRQKLKYLEHTNLLRVKLASDLHDEVGGLLNKSAMQSEIAKSIVNEEAKPILDKIAYNCRQAMSSMRDIMWNLDARNDSIEHLLDRIREYAQNMLGENYDYEVDIRAMENTNILPEKRQAIYLIVKEGINNILKHSKKGKVKISLFLQNKTVHLVIFSESPFIKNEFSTGQGLKNMQMRTEKVKGTFELNLENGVKIIVNMPFS